VQEHHNQAFPSDQAEHRYTGAPHCLLRLAESRVLFEAGAFAASSPFLRLVGRGDRHPVLVLPGFTAGDLSTAPLRMTIRSQGYWAHGWNLGLNVGPTDRILDGIHERLELLYERHQRPVSVVGWSLGGVYARELAREHPEMVRQVITLGSPFRLTMVDRSSISGLVDRLSPTWSAEVLRLASEESAKPPLTVPSTAIYSRTDGVVRWHTCIDVVQNLHENIEVRGSHSGLGFNPAVQYAISDRLMQPADEWKPFKPPFAARAWYPRPASWDEVRNRNPKTRPSKPRAANGRSHVTR
jgi:pimeloyl-ACP methyl ester carboxylesterase